MKRTPLYECHRKLNAQLTDFGGFEMPVRFQGDKVEHFAVRSKVGLFDVSHMGEIFVEGENALSDVNRLITNDVSKIGDGEALYTHMLNERGGIIDDLIVYRFSPNKFMFCANASNREKDFNWIKHHVPYAVEQSDQWGLIAIQGPNAEKLLSRLCLKSGVDTLQRFHFAVVEINTGKGKAVSVIAARTGYTGEDGFEVFVPAENSCDLWQTLVREGEHFGLQTCGLAARDTLRLEAGMCLYGNDIDESMTPYEAGLRWVVKLDKKDGFIGQQKIIQQKAEGINKKLVGLEILGKGIARHNYNVFNKEEQKVGTVTSGTLTPSLNRSIAMAVIEKPYFKQDSEVLVDIRGRKVHAKVVKLPFYKKNKES